MEEDWEFSLEYAMFVYLLEWAVGLWEPNVQGSTLVGSVHIGVWHVDGN